MKNITTATWGDTVFLLDSETPGAAPDLIFSASDLVTASECEYRLLRILDEKLGRMPKATFDDDPMLERTSRLGDVHEHRVLEDFLARHGEWNPDSPAGVYDVVPATELDRTSLTHKHNESIAALEAGADVVFQAAFFDGRFHGRSDFLVRQRDNMYAVYDTKLARHAKVSALLQLAAYGDQLIKAGVTAAPQVTLVLGNGEHSNHSLADILPVFRERRERFLALVEAHRNQPATVEWDGSGHTSCGRCNYCTEQVRTTRDLLLVSNMSLSRRKKLHEQGVFTIDQLAAMEVSGTDRSMLRLRRQARMQTGTGTPDGSVKYSDKDGIEHRLSYSVLPGHSLGALPAPSPGDIFFDFEGDPLWQDPVTKKWGLEYLFGVIGNPDAPGTDPPFNPFWAHSRSEERKAFTDFLDYVAQRRRQYPDMRIYHYAAYEKTALRNLSLTHIVGEDAVDTLLREGVLVDLYETVRNSICISESSYSIKKLEPLYMGANLRSGDVTDAGASVVAYADFCEARDSGNAALASGILAGISDYNRYDCLSTLGLRNWLLSLATERGVVSSVGTTVGEEQELPVPEQPSPEESRLLDYVASVPTNRARTNDEQAVAMVAAAVGYHRREDKQFWWAHFDRLEQAMAEWAETRNVFVVESAEALTGWERPTPRSNPMRTIRLTGVMAEGSEFTAGKKFFRMYEPPWPEDLKTGDLHQTHGRAGWFGTEVVEQGHDSFRDVLIVSEKLKRAGTEYEQFPVALAPDQPIATTSIRAALAGLAQQVGASLPSLPRSPGLEILRKAAPRLSGITALPPVQDGLYAAAITTAVNALDYSYLAIQGPPGTGKTYVGSHVIAALVARGWKVGVVGQSHAVVEHMLEAALEAGVPAQSVAKKTARTEAPWAHCSDEGVAALLDNDGGCLVGGTTWTMTGGKVPPESLDLLVIDEAGQYSLANTLAVSRSTKRLLLLGDPQQLPQVTQGSHPEPVDESALGWLSKGYATLPENLGYFLADSWRMHPDLCAPVSRLSYEGKLHSAPAAVARRLVGVPAGVECVMVAHIGNTTSSVEEAVEVVAQVRRHLGLSWSERPDDAPRPLERQDILIVAAYNAQVQLIQSCLEDAGLTDMRVGTVDRFQGRQAPVVIVSMACSAASEAPRGIEFLLNRNRINVAVSRGQWRAVLIRSPELTHHLPNKPEAFEQLGAFVGLCETAVQHPSQNTEPSAIRAPSDAVCGRS